MTSSAAKPASSMRSGDLAGYWWETRLRHSLARSVSHRPGAGAPTPWLEVMQQILSVGYGSRPELRRDQGAWQRIPRRTVPSAGAIYPYEIFAALPGSTHIWEIETGRLLSWACMGGLLETAAELGIVSPHGRAPEALLVFAARPWLAMQKYSRRGYGYAHLDVGHAAANVAFYTAALGQQPVIHLRFAHREVADRLGLVERCREPLVVLSFCTAAGAAQGPNADAGQTQLGEQVAGERVDPRELEAWTSLDGLLSYDFELSAPQEPTAGWPLAEPEDVTGEWLALPATASWPHQPREWRRAILERRSAKGFFPQSVSLEALAAILDALRVGEIPSDCAADTPARLGLRVLARRVDGANGVYTYHPNRHALQRIDDSFDSPQAACMQQALAEDAAAVLVFHAPIRRLSERHGYSGFAEVLFRAGELAQRMHIVASRLAELGITCIGGFDGEECGRIARLKGDEEPVYVVLLGVPDESATKFDRLSIAFSHGHATRMD